MFFFLPHVFFPDLRGKKHEHFWLWLPKNKGQDSGYHACINFDPTPSCTIVIVGLSSNPRARKGYRKFRVFPALTIHIYIYIRDVAGSESKPGPGLKSKTRTRKTRTNGNSWFFAFILSGSWCNLLSLLRTMVISVNNVIKCS